MVVGVCGGGFLLLFTIIFTLFFNVSGCFACIDISKVHACSAREAQKRAVYPLELESQMVVGHHMDVGKQTWSSAGLQVS